VPSELQELDTIELKLF